MGGFQKILTSIEFLPDTFLGRELFGFRRDVVDIIKSCMALSILYHGTDCNLAY